MNASTPQSHFIVTTPGLSATRWLSFVLASNPAVFVAHGKHPLDSVVHGQFQRERHIDDLESITHGNLAAEFYERASLDAIFAEYQRLMPAAQAAGNVHTFTLESLIRKAGGVDALKGYSVVNLLRHPVRYIASHAALVRSARSYPLYQHYAEAMFPQAIREFPELLLLECEDYDAFLAFAVSCLSVHNLKHDLVGSAVASIQMERITTDRAALKELCEALTGLPYPEDQLTPFLRNGPINQHQKHSQSESAREVFDGWAAWQQDMARMMIPAQVLDAHQAAGYDVSMLRLEDAARLNVPMNGRHEEKRSCPVLGDRLRELNPEHPLLQSDHRPCSEKPPELVDEGCNGFNILSYRGQFYALAQTIGPFNLESAPDEEIRRLQADGRCHIAATLAGVLQQIQPDRTPPPPALAFQLFEDASIPFEDHFKAVARSFDRDDADGNRLRQLYEDLAAPPLLHSRKRS